MSYRDIEHHCVTCGIQLTQSANGGRYESCGRCGGVWVDFATFRATFNAAQPDHPIDELMIHNDGTPRRACPHCQQRMDIVWLEFLKLDQCQEHGVWFDGGELRCALRYEVIPDSVRKMMALLTTPRNEP